MTEAHLAVDNDEPRLRLQQAEMWRYAFESRGSGPWTVLYRSWHEDERNGAEFAALAPVSYRQQALGEASWDLSIGQGLPGFEQSYHEGEPETRYLRYGGDVIEPIVIVQEHFGIKPRMLPQLSEEFRHFHSLWAEPNGKTLVKVHNDGTEEIAAEVDDALVKVRTKYLRQFQAARQLDLWLYIDSVEYFADLDPDASYSDLEAEESTDDCRYFLFIGCFDKKLGPFSRLNGKRVFAPPPVEKCGVWPFEQTEQEYPEFIIGEDEHGEQTRFTCDPDKLANYFGANPDAPHYLTPVSFRREVLQRYYEDPDRYSVEDGYLRCGGLWGLQIDNNGQNHVIVFLGDLGRDLPASERHHWLACNVPPTGLISRTAYNRSFRAQFTEPSAADLRFKSRYGRFCRRWELTLGWPLFKPLHDADRHVLSRLRIPLTETHPEFEAQVLGLTKLLVDALNEGKLAAEVGGALKDEKGISKLKRWLESQNYSHTERDIQFLKRLQRLRSRLSAHRKGSDYHALLREEGVEDQPSAEITAQLESALAMLADLEKHFDLSEVAK